MNKLKEILTGVDYLVLLKATATFSAVMIVMFYAQMSKIELTPEVIKAFLISGAGAVFLWLLVFGDSQPAEKDITPDVTVDDAANDDDAEPYQYTVDFSDLRASQTARSRGDAEPYEITAKTSPVDDLAAVREHIARNQLEMTAPQMKAELEQYWSDQKFSKVFPTPKKKK